MLGYCSYCYNRMDKCVCTPAEIKEDVVNKPKHYNHNHKGIECINAIEAALTTEEFRGYLKGSIMKYTWREGYKNGLEDNKKGQWYYNLLVKVTESIKNAVST